MVAGHIVPYVVEYGLSHEQAALIMGLYAIANAGGRLFFGYAFDAFGAPLALPGTVLTMSLGLFLLATLPGQIGGLGVLLGVVPVAMAYGGTIPQFSALIVLHFGTRHMNANLGFSAVSLFVAALLGPALGSWVRMSTGSYTMAILLAACTTLMGVLPAWRLTRRNHVFTADAEKEY